MLKNHLNLNISVGWIQELLHETSYLEYNKMQRAPLLTKLHRSAHMDFSRQQLQWNGKKWQRVLFSDEKSSTWMDPTASHATGMTWASIQDFLTQGNKGVLLFWFEGHFILRCIASGSSCGQPGFCQVLRDPATRLSSVCGDMLGENCTFQQETASIHRSQYTKKWLKDKNVDVMCRTMSLWSFFHFSQPRLRCTYALQWHNYAYTPYT